MAETVIATREATLMRLDPQALIAKAIDAGAGIDTIERLVALAKDIREVQAKEAWYAAMAEFQETCPTIYKTNKANIPTRSGGGFSYSYAPLDEILSVVQPVMGKLGLSVSWTHRFEAATAVSNCRISHELGHHEESGDVTIPIDKSEDGRGASSAQRVGIAMTYSKRYSLLAAIGKAPEDDEDGDAGDTRDTRQASDSQGARKPAGSGSGATESPVISGPQLNRFWAIARGMKPVGWTEEQVHDLLTAHQINHAKEIPVVKYEALCDVLKAGPKK
jgi:hypothetical protein